MKRFIEGECRTQAVLFPEKLDDWIGEDNPVRAIDAFVGEIDVKRLGLRAPSPPSLGDPRTTQRRF